MGVDDNNNRINYHVSLVHLLLPNGFCLICHLTFFKYSTEFGLHIWSFLLVFEFVLGDSKAVKWVNFP